MRSCSLPVARQAGQISAQAKQITALTAQVAELAAANEALGRM